MSNVTENPNDKQSPGKPLSHNEVVPTEDNGLAENQVIDVDEDGVARKRDEQDVQSTLPPSKERTLGGISGSQSERGT